MPRTARQWVLAVLLVAILCAALTPGALTLAAAIAGPAWVFLYLLTRIAVSPWEPRRVAARAGVVPTVRSRPPPALAAF